MLLLVTEIRLPHKIQQILMVITDEEPMASSSRSDLSCPRDL